MQLIPTVLPRRLIVDTVSTHTAWRIINVPPRYRKRNCLLPYVQDQSHYGLADEQTNQDAQRDRGHEIERKAVETVIGDKSW